MSEQISTPEKVSREQALAMYRKFVERGITSPDALDLNDPEVIEANKLFEKWDAQESVKGDFERHNFEKTKFYVDAGFTDSNYLGDVLGWLFQDAGDIEKQPDNPTRVQLRSDYAKEIKKIRDLLGLATGGN
ncbi:MAG: hypothetical protein A2735_00305 [Candidatus Yanofskybacteria bacterium RIFCSPHIGHO2_01_FULL_41_21]|uniref:Uncharacterized protein n=1 Tax=Candidatus Yanofskybacteria bacterium RIFCSPHIGHO2_01_FULL_41_21 TaxID=1802660 RepID=A0A1F8EBA0_9BACT|nr:MAG: hypothetical protein A2735_00305 [Candidatus Yanofskybacteria bacterium RIFCSPHIGHO2_01_FULL_41_21]